ncbi:MAG: FAD-dependent oxidoreductase [Nanoarchaeota archaeon]
MSNQYDVIIIGAGPAGLSCANQLKKSNLSILLIEKNKIIGPKICAGGLSNLNKDLNIKEEKLRNFQSQKIYIKEQEHTIPLNNPLKIISRFELGQYQLKKIQNHKNIKILKNTKTTKIKKNEIITSQGSFKFKYLIGADGSNSIVRQHLKLKSKICIGGYYNIPKITNELILYFNPKQLRSGYIWVFPHKTHTNIGVFYNPKFVSAQNSKINLENFLKSQKLDFSQSKFESAAINYSYNGCIFDNIFLIGDAAGLASKTTGEGIPFAIISGEEIAKKLINKNYEMYELNKILERKQKQEKMLKVFEDLPFTKQHLFIKMFFNIR